MGGAKYPSMSMITSVSALANRLTAPFVPAETMAALASTLPSGELIVAVEWPTRLAKRSNILTRPGELQ